MKPSLSPPLGALARAYGLSLGYVDASGKRQRATPRALKALLREMGVPVSEDLANVPWLLRERRAFLRSRPLKPVLRLDGVGRRVRARLPTDAKVRLIEEGGRVRRCARQSGGWIDLPRRLPVGYHRLRVESSEGTWESLVLRSPAQAYRPPRKTRAWGIFAPLYSLRGDRDLGIGSFGDLERLLEWQHGLGARLLATLPMLAAFLDRPFTEPSPYAPTTRLFWNEIYVDVEGLGARERRTSFVNYRQVARRKRRELAPVARRFFAHDCDRERPYREFLARCPEVTAYAEWRAGSSPHDRDYHLYAQFLADRQMRSLRARCRKLDTAFYLDFPLGVHRDGFDVWRHPDLFLRGVSVGAPPDAFFPGGQNWGFPPMSPEAARESGYRYFIDVIRRHVEHCDVLRIDHVMGLHRLFCIPPGVPNGEGVYLNYDYADLYAILKIESQRARTVLVGEDLGTVPSIVRREMRRHGIERLYVLQYEITPQAKRIPSRVPRHSLASLNTHDMPPFRAFLTGADIELRRELGILPTRVCPRERRDRRRLRQVLDRALRVRSPDPSTELFASLDFLARSSSPYVLVNLEDLWGEERPQNVPGTATEYPNWRRRLRKGLGEIAQDVELRDLLRRVDSRRRWS